jgi:hypothetical protein
MTLTWTDYLNGSRVKVDDMDDTVLTLTDQPWNLGDWQIFVEKCWSSDDNGPDDCTEPELAY